MNNQHNIQNVLTYIANVVFLARRCPHPGDIPNGRREGNTFIFPNRVTYVCAEGYTLIGRNYRVCQANGEWSGNTPTCKRK